MRFLNIPVKEDVKGQFDGRRKAIGLEAHRYAEALIRLWDAATAEQRAAALGLGDSSVNEGTPSVGNAA